VIHRKTLKVRLKGSREVGDLRPSITDDLPRGVNLRVLEYGVDYAVVEIWGSDILDGVEKCTPEKLVEVAGHPDVIEELVVHPARPTIVGRIVIAHMVGMEIDEVRKIIRYKGKEYSYIRKERFREADVYVLDEG